MKRARALLFLLALAALIGCDGKTQITADQRPGSKDTGEIKPLPLPQSKTTEQDVEAKDIDPYFVESKGISNEAGPKVITRNILQDRSGNFWLATWNGVMRFDGKSFTNVTNKEGLRRYRTFSLLEDHQGNIWLGTCGAGLYRFDGKSYVNFTTEDGLIDDVVLSMMQDKDNNIWFGGMGLTKFDGSEFTSFSEKEGFTNSDVNSISQAPDGSIWFGTRGALFQYDGNSFVNFTEKHGLEISSYIPMIIDQHGHLWFSGENGVYHYDGDHVQHIFESTSFSLFEDSKGNVWFSGGKFNGAEPKPGTTVLNRFDPSHGLENILSSSTQFEIAGGMLFGIHEDAEGNIWFGTGRGIGRIQGDDVKYF